jgi:hypothetical protein
MRRLFGSEINEEKGGTYRKDVGIGRFDFLYSLVVFELLAPLKAVRVDELTSPGITVPTIRPIRPSGTSSSLPSRQQKAQFFNVGQCVS